MDFKIRTTYRIEDTHEFSVECNGLIFLVIYGRRVNDEWFIAIPGWNFSTRGAEPEDAYYNTEKLRMSDIGSIKDAADSIAFAIKFHYESLRGGI